MYMSSIVKPEKKKALFVAILASAILILVFTLTSNAVRAHNEPTVSVGATSSVEVNVRAKPFTGARATTTNGRVEERRGNAREEREERRVNVEERKARIASSTQERREKITHAAKERAKAYLVRVVRRLQAAVDRFEKFSIRIDARIDKLEKAGITMTKAKELLAKANTEIGEADAAVAALKASIEATITAERPREIFAEVKERIRLAIDAVKEAHAALVAAIRAVKAAGGVRADQNAAPVDVNASVDATVQTNQ